MKSKKFIFKYINFIQKELSLTKENFFLNKGLIYCEYNK